MVWEYKIHKNYLVEIIYFISPILIKRHIMEFCDECGSMMLPSTVEGKKVFKCRCGAIKDFSDEYQTEYDLVKIYSK